MAYFARRIGFFLLTVWAAVTLNFLIPRLQPGDPAEQIVRRLTGQNRAVDPAQVEAVRLMLGIQTDQSLLEQYVAYLGTLARGEFGVSYTYFPYTVTHMIGQTLPWTLVLVGVTTILGFVIGTLLGAWAAWKRNSAFDSIISLGSTFFGTLPFFWIAMILIWVFAFELGWFPYSGGYGGGVNPGWNWPFIQDAARHSVLPALSILITSWIGWMFGMRNNMVQILGEDYTRLARAKGLKPRRIALWYGARVAVLPNVTALALSLGFILGGSIVVEQIFGFPGTGQLMYEALGNRDYPLMQTIFLFSTIGVLIANFVADMLYGWLDPRVRQGGEA
jgi:peptide/nickel transport system permease protein